MALGPTGTLNNATPGSSTFPLALRHYDNQLPGSGYILLGRHQAPLMAMLTAGMGLPTESVSDKKYDDLTHHPPITDFKIEGSSSAGADAAISTTTTLFKIVDAGSATISNANQLVQVGDQLHIPSGQANQTTAEGTVAVAGEVIEVVAVAGDGTYFTATRNVGSTASTANVAASSGNYLDCKLMNPADNEDTRSRVGQAHALQSQTNYIQNSHKSFELTKDLAATLLSGGNEWNRHMEIQHDRFMAGWEWTMIAGRLALNSSQQYKTKGWLPYIVGDTTTYAAYSSSTDMLNGDGTARTWKIGNPANLSPENWMRVMERVYSEGSGNKVLVAGPGFITQLILAFEGYWTMPIPSMGSGGFDINLTLNGIRTSKGEMRIMEHPGFKGPHFYDAMIIDLDYVGLRYFNGGAYDQGMVHIWRGLNGSGLQDNDSTKLKWAWAAQMGAHMAYPLAHAYFWGMEGPDGALGGPRATVGTLTPSNT